MSCAEWPNDAVGPQSKAKRVLPQQKHPAPSFDPWWSCSSVHNLPGGIEKHEDSGLRKEIIKKSSTSHFPQWMIHDWIGCCFHEMLTSSLQWAEANEDPCQQKKIGYPISESNKKTQKWWKRGGVSKFRVPIICLFPLATRNIYHFLSRKIESMHNKPGSKASCCRPGVNFWKCSKWKPETKG